MDPLIKSPSRNAQHKMRKKLKRRNTKERPLLPLENGNTPGKKGWYRSSSEKFKLELEPTNLDHGGNSDQKESKYRQSFLMQASLSPGFNCSSFADDSGQVNMDSLGKSVSLSFLKRHIKTENKSVSAIRTRNRLISPIVPESQVNQEFGKLDGDRVEKLELQRDIREYCESNKISETTSKVAKEWIAHLLRVYERPLHQEFDASSVNEKALAVFMENATKEMESMLKVSGRHVPSKELLQQSILNQLSESIAKECNENASGMQPTIASYFRGLLTDLPKALIARDEKLEHAQALRDASKAEIGRLVENEESLNTQVQKLRRELGVSYIEVDELKAANADMEELLDETVAAELQSTKHNTTLQARIVELQSQLETETTMYENKFTSLRDQIHTLENSAKKQQLKMNSMQVEMQHKDSSIEKLQAQIDVLEKQQEKLFDLQQQLIDADCTNKKLKSKLSTSTSKTANLEEKIVAFEAEPAASAVEASIRCKYEMEMNILREDMENMHVRNMEIESLLNKERDERKKKESSIHELDYMVQQYEANTKNLEATIVKLECQQGALRTRLVIQQDPFKAEVQTLNDSIKGLKGEKKQLLIDYKEVCDSRKVLQLSLSKANNANTFVSGRVENLLAKLRILKTQFHDVRQDVGTKFQDFVASTEVAKKNILTGISMRLEVPEEPLNYMALCNVRQRAANMVVEHRNRKKSVRGLSKSHSIANMRRSSDVTGAVVIPKSRKVHARSPLYQSISCELVAVKQSLSLLRDLTLSELKQSELNHKKTSDQLLKFLVRFESEARSKQLVVRQSVVQMVPNAELSESSVASEKSKKNSSKGFARKGTKKGQKGEKIYNQNPSKQFESDASHQFDPKGRRKSSISDVDYSSNDESKLSTSRRNKSKFQFVDSMEVCSLEPPPDDRKPSRISNAIIDGVMSLHENTKPKKVVEHERAPVEQKSKHPKAPAPKMDLKDVVPLEQRVTSDVWQLSREILAYGAISENMVDSILIVDAEEEHDEILNSSEDAEAGWFIMPSNEQTTEISEKKEKNRQRNYQIRVEASRARFLKLINCPVDHIFSKEMVHNRSQGWVLKHIRELLDDRFITEAAYFRSRIPNMPLPEFVIEWLVVKYGICSLVNKTCREMYRGIQKFRITSLEIDIFGCFLCEKFDTMDLSFFLYSRTFIACSSTATDTLASVRLRVAEAVHILASLFKAQHVAHRMIVFRNFVMEFLSPILNEMVKQEKAQEALKKDLAEKQAQIEENNASRASHSVVELPKVSKSTLVEATPIEAVVEMEAVQSSTLRNAINFVLGLKIDSPDSLSMCVTKLDAVCNKIAATENEKLIKLLALNAEQFLYFALVQFRQERRRFGLLVKTALRRASGSLTGSADTVYLDSFTFQTTMENLTGWNSNLSKLLYASCIATINRTILDEDMKIESLSVKKLIGISLSNYSNTFLLQRYGSAAVVAITTQEADQNTSEASTSGNLNMESIKSEARKSSYKLPGTTTLKKPSSTRRMSIL